MTAPARARHFHAGHAEKPLRHQCVQMIAEFTLESRVVLRNVRQSYYLDGVLNAERNNLVIVFHALTGSSDAVGDWWHNVAGPGRAIDTNKYAVLCTNLLGSCYGTTGPSDPDHRPFPAVTTRDMARLVEHLVGSLHISSVALAIGGSLGGMVALEFAATFPTLTRRVIALAAPAVQPASALGWDHLQRRAILMSEESGLELARMIAMMSYRTAKEFDDRFGRATGDDGDFAVTRYLSRHGEKLRARFDAHTYLALLDTMDSHDVGRDRGGASAALGRVKGRVIGVGIPGDLLYDQREVRRWTSAAGLEYREILSDTGHDSFLTEGSQVSVLVRNALAEPAVPGGSNAADADPVAGDAAATGEATGEATADVVILGYGRVGRELAHQLSERADQPKVRVVGIIDSTGYVVEPEGLTATRLAETSNAKGAGVSLADVAGGISGGAGSALAALRRHALTRPILVDATASDTDADLKTALSDGMDLVLANKRPLAAPQGVSGGLARLARDRGRRLLHEATVGAGLPIIDTIAKLQESGDEVLGITGCPSGTLGYLFAELGRGVSFSVAVRSAQSLGYTEPDPRDDLSGMDVARKALILGRLLGFTGNLDSVEVESLVPDSLREVGAEEFLARVGELDEEWRGRVEAAKSGGRVLRYRAAVTAASVRVELAAVDASDSLATLTDTNNQFAITTRRYRDHPLVIIGPGAGTGITAAGVLNDVLRLARTR